MNTTNSSVIVTTIVEELSSTQNTILGSVGVGLGGVSFLVLAYRVLAAEFAPNEDGKRPSISEVVCRRFRREKPLLPINPVSVSS
jgi:hypothetical protein